MSYDLAMNRVYRDWLRDPTNGLNAHLALLVTDGLVLPGDTVPANLATAAIADETDPNVAATGFPDVAEGQSAIGLTRYQPFSLPGEVFTVAGQRDLDDYPTLLAYRLETSDAGLAFTTWSYVYRATVRSLRRLFLQANENAREASGVKLFALPRVEILPRFQLVEGKVATGGLVLHSQARDLKP